MVEHMQAHERCAVWAGMGMGKTVNALTAVDELSLVDDVYPVLAVAPKRVALSTWPTEAQKWDHLKNIEVSPILGDQAQRRRAMAADANVFTTNYENLPWLIQEYGDRGQRWPYRTLLLDESTRLKGFRTRQGTKRAKALNYVAHGERVKRVVEMTGTPSPNGLKDLWGQAWFLDRGARLGTSYTAFTQRWFRPAFDGFGVEPLTHAFDQITEALRDLCLTVRAEDWFDLKDPIVTDVVVDLPPSARKAYDDLEKRMFTEIDGHEIEAFFAASRTMKCLQAASGALYVDEKAENWKVIHDEKIDALDSIVEEASGMPVLVAYHFKSDLARLKAAFPQGRALDAKAQTVADWNAGRIPLLFVHPASAGHGLNLQDGGNILVFFTLNWNLEEYLQVIERIGPTRQLQAGHNRNVFIYRILARDTVDQLVLERLTTKRAVQDVLLEAMRRR